MKVQIYSDIHIEFYKKYPKIERNAEILILAGDIGKLNLPQYTAFLEYINSTWEQVIYVLGNHEFYHNKKTYNVLMNDYIDLFNKYERIKLLHDCSEFLYKNYRFIGCTLWSFARDKLTNCFSKIKMINPNTIKKEGISVDFYNSLYQTQKQQLIENIGNNTIVITHYPITQYNTSSPKYCDETEETKLIFANNIIDELGVEKCVFISGHTHYSFDFEYKNNRFISHQFGYPDEIKMGETNLNMKGVYNI